MENIVLAYRIISYKKILLKTTVLKKKEVLKNNSAKKRLLINLQTCEQMWLRHSDYRV